MKNENQNFTNFNFYRVSPFNFSKTRKHRQNTTTRIGIQRFLF